MEIYNKPLAVNHDKGRGGQKPLAVVLHIIGLPGVTGASAYAHFSNPNNEVSAHYIVLRNGVIWRLVNESDTAWCNGQVVNPTNDLVKMYYKKGISINQITVSIEHEGSEYEDLTPIQYKASSDLVRDICVRHAIPIDSIHVMGHRNIKATKSCPGKLDVQKVITMANAVIPIQPDLKPVIDVDTVFIPPETQTRISILKQLIEATKKLIALLMERNRSFGVARNSQWNKESKLFLVGKTCLGCGRKATVVHHLRPVHKFPLEEMNPENWAVVCDECHFQICHLRYYASWNENALIDLKFWLNRITKRP